MKIAMFTNTYLPHVGGVARSVQTLEDTCRKMGHEVRVVAPVFDNIDDSPHVLRVPAIQHFNGSDFSVRLPVPNLIRDFIDDFAPDVIHSHHPFLLGDAALRESWKTGAPIVFTHHTLYERYTHYVPLDSPALKRIAVQLATEYCNLCDEVIAPSDSIARLLRERGVTAPIRSIPTGIDTAFFARGDGAGFREKTGIPSGAKVIGHVGRLAAEKNLLFLAEALAQRLEESPEAWVLLVGDGDVREQALNILRRAGGRVVAPGTCTGGELADAYAAMNAFAFTSQTETQGIVLAEAMAAGVPVVALDGPGVREVLRDGENGLLLDADSASGDLAAALGRLMDAPDFLQRCSEGARRTAADYDAKPCARRIVDRYEALIAGGRKEPEDEPPPWDRFLAGVEIEWNLLSAKVAAAAAALTSTPATEARLD